jgi:DNA polymerase III subunit epsilon
MKVFVFDTETTDLVKNSLVPLEQQPRIIEFFGHTVDSESGEVIEELEFICNPGHKLSPTTTRITGLKDIDVESQPMFKSFEGQVRSIIGGADAVVAHNLSFDYALVEAEMSRCGTQVNWPIRRICTVQETEWIKGHRLSLTALHEELFGEPFTGAHRARKDVEALTRCVLELFKRGDL